jgi:hypothetical protein
MAATSTSTAIAAAESVFTEPERLALAGFLAGYTGLTREAYALHLRQFAGWCRQHHIRLFQARRAHIEGFARDLEARGRARATITRRLCTVAGFYRYAVEEEFLDHAPVARTALFGPTMTACGGSTWRHPDGPMWPRFKQAATRRSWPGVGPDLADMRMLWIKLGPLQAVRVEPGQGS